MNRRKFPVNDSMAIGLLADMKKCLIWILLLGAGFSLFAQTRSNASIFIPPVSGIGKTPDDNTVIAQMLTNEIKARHGVLGKSLQKADYILYGTIAPYHQEQQFYHDYLFLNAEDTSTDISIYTYNSMLRESWQQVFIFQLILKNQKTNKAILLQNLLYHSIEDVYDFFPLLMFNIYSKINVKQTPDKQVADIQTPDKQADTETDTEDWRNKRLYLRVSFDFPITFYTLKSDGLSVNNGLYNPGPPAKMAAPLDNKIVALPGMTLGLEKRLFNWLSIEPNLQIGWEYLGWEYLNKHKDFINIAAGLQLKFPLKFISNIMLEPYGAVSYPIPIKSSPVLTASSVFDSYPMFAYGGGLQVGMKGWKQTGSFFIDINYMYYSDFDPNHRDAVLQNPYKDLYPEPKVIHYQRTVLGLGMGYKFGVTNRK